jgi:hypothetical protein
MPLDQGRPRLKLVTWLVPSRNVTRAAVVAALAAATRSNLVARSSPALTTLPAAVSFLIGRLSCFARG